MAPSQKSSAARTSKTRTVFRCSECGAPSPKWTGRCGTCGEWNSLVEEAEGPVSAQAVTRPTTPAGPIGAVDTAQGIPVPTGIAELDRVLGGGLVPGSVTLLGGEPGVGKSTLLLQLLGAVARQGRRSLLITGEESLAQVRSRAERLQAIAAELWLAAETSLPSVLGQIEHAKADVVVIDSIQTMHDPELASTPGSVGQVRSCSHALVRVAKESGVTVILVGHVTKEGSLAGPRVLEHVVDTVLEFEGDRHYALRLLRAVKHRFGATGELGLFDMEERGLVAVEDPAGLFIGSRDNPAPGSVVGVAMEGARPLLIETQALVTDSALSFPRRVATGVDANRLSVLLAVLEQRAGQRLAFCDVFAALVGGLRVTEPAIDLALCLALVSSFVEHPLAADLVAVGEVGLTGEIRSVSQLARRLQEAVRLGFSTAVVPMSTPDVRGLQLIRVQNVNDAVEAFALRRPTRKGRRRDATASSEPTAPGRSRRQPETASDDDPF